MRLPFVPKKVLQNFLIRKTFFRVFPSPMKRIFNVIFKTVNPKSVSVLECFARGADWHTIAYAPHIGQLELWEIDSAFEHDLRSRFPDATTHIVDSYKRLAGVPTKKFTVVVVDNPVGAHGGHQEHFDVFPSVLAWLEDPSFLILNIVPAIDAKARANFPFAFDEHHLQARRVFYRTETPHCISVGHMIEIYRVKCSEAGWVVRETSVESRGTVKYLLLGLHRACVSGCTS